MISFSKEGCWNRKDRKAVINYIKPLLFRYFFKEATPNLEVALRELNLSDTDLNYLKTVHFLLSPQVESLVKILPKLVRNLSHSTHKEVVEYRGIVRGRIDWNMTFKERYSQGFNDPSLFICQPTIKKYDLPENQLLKYILWKIRSLTESIELSIPKELIEPEYWESWIDIIVTRYLKIKKISKNIYFQQISTPRIVKPKMVHKAYRNRNNVYDKIAECYELYEKLFITNDQEALRELVEKQIFEPLNNDKLFEIYVVIKLLNLLDNAKGDFELGLFKPGQNYTARYTDNDLEICVLYQKMPKIFMDYSKNKEIFEYYDPNVSLRRPDIILKFQQGENKFYRLIEVKRTKERNYIVESVYKVLGYLNDFEYCFNETFNPQGILVIWDGANIKDMKNALKQPVFILQDKNMEDGLCKILGIDIDYEYKLVERLLSSVEQDYGLKTDEVLKMFSIHFRASIPEVMLFMSLVDNLTAKDIFITIDEIENPDRRERFIMKPNDVIVYDKNGNIKSEPKNWIKFGKEWYDKRELLKNRNE